MCSISGVSFVPGSTINRHKLATALLSEGESRGRDASGFGWVNPNGDGIYKKDLPGGKLNVGRIPADTTAMILHTRNGTHGSAKDNANNHPVESPSGDIRLVHNGVVYNHDEMRDLLGKEGKALPDVDSSVIPAMIEVYGLESTSEISGYAACAWFDRETGNTIHLARFKQAPIVYAMLWDGSFAFASTADILGRALTKAGVEWYGMFPTPFESFGEAEYMQIMEGEVIRQSTVEWNKAYSYQGPNWNSVTSSATTARPTSTSTYMGGTTTSAAVVKAEDTADEDQPMAMSDSDFEFDEPDEKVLRAAVSTLFSNENRSIGELSDEEYTAWLRTGSIYGETEVAEAWYEEEPRLADVVGSIHPLVYTMTHDGDYQTYTTTAGMLSSLTWWAGINAGEDHLVGPDEGNLRWVNHFADIGSLSEDGSEQHSWVQSEPDFQLVSEYTPVWIRDGVTRLRQLVGA